MNQLHQNSNGDPRLLGFLFLESFLYLGLSAGAESKSILKDLETGILDFLASFIFNFSVIFLSESNLSSSSRVSSVESTNLGNLLLIALQILDMLLAITLQMLWLFC